MWKSILKTERFSFFDIVMLSAAANEAHNGNWLAWGIISLVWIALVVLISLYYKKK